MESVLEHLDCTGCFKKDDKILRLKFSILKLADVLQSLLSEKHITREVQPWVTFFLRANKGGTPFIFAEHAFFSEPFLSDFTEICDLCNDTLGKTGMKNIDNEETNKTILETGNISERN